MAVGSEKRLRGTGVAPGCRCGCVMLLVVEARREPHRCGAVAQPPRAAASREAKRTWWRSCWSARGVVGAGDVWRRDGLIVGPRLSGLGRGPRMLQCPCRGWSGAKMRNSRRGLRSRAWREAVGGGRARRAAVQGSGPRPQALGVAAEWPEETVSRVGTQAVLLGQHRKVLEDGRSGGVATTARSRARGISAMPFRRSPASSTDIMAVRV